MLVCQSCSDFLKEKNPVGRQNIYVTESDLEAAVEGVLSGFSYSNGITGESNEAFPIASGLVHWGKSESRLNSNKWKSALKFVQYASNDWNGKYFRSLYTPIFRANALIAGLKTSPVDEEYKLEIEAEAKLYRAVAYFHAVRIWGDIPLRLEEVSIENASAKARAPYYDVYVQIIRDLEEAEAFMRRPARVKEVRTGIVRPDKFAASLLEGKVGILVDTSPFGIIVPATLNSFYQASEDYYQRWQIMSFTRILRYLVSLMSFILPGLYVAILNFHPDILPTPFAISIAASREGITFSTVTEIIVIEIIFELFREAGIRAPGAIGHVISLVGGLVIGQAAVDAKIISPMILIVVAFTAICTFAIPDYNLTSAFRLVRYLFIALGAMFGLYGFAISMLFILAHLSSLESFKVPYLAPYSISDQNGSKDLKDTIVRFPTFMQTTRPIFAKRYQRTRLRLKNRETAQDVVPAADKARSDDKQE